MERTVYPTVPPKVEYNLTSLGNSLHDTVQALVVWMETHQAKIAEARSRYEARLSEDL